MTNAELEYEIEMLGNVLDEIVCNREWSAVNHERYWRLKAVQTKFINALAEQEAQAERFYGVDARSETFGDW